MPLALATVPLRNDGPLRSGGRGLFVLLVSALVVLLAHLPAPARAQTYATFNLTPVADTYVDSGNTSLQCSTCNQLEVNTHVQGESRLAYRFSLASIPSGSRIVSATLRVWATVSLWETVSLYRITTSWPETATWTSVNGFTYNPTVLTSFMPNETGRYFDLTLTSTVAQWFYGTTSNFGVVLVQPNGNSNASARLTSREWGTVSQRPQLVVVTIPPPLFVPVRTSTVVSDPANGVTSPKRIPGAVVTNTVRYENRSSGYTDENTVFFTEAVQAPNQTMFVGDLGAAGSGPVTFAQGTPTSGTGYTYSGLASMTDSLSFSSDNGVTFNYVPAPDASGYDPLVTHFKVTPTGSFAGEAGSGFPQFTLTTRVKVR